MLKVRKKIILDTLANIFILLKSTSKMDKNLAQRAIKYALIGKWKEAEKLNLQILEKDSEDIDALNRLAKAYAQQGLSAKAIKTSLAVLKLDPFNNIASRCAEKWKSVKVGSSLNLGSADVFLEEPGKTKIVSLVHVGNYTQLSKLDCGDEVKLNPFGHRVTVSSIEGKYIGKLPDDIGSRIKKLISLGNSYSTFIKNVDKKGVSIFIKEKQCSKKGSGFTSFPVDKINYISYTPPELVHEKKNYVSDESE